MLISLGLQYLADGSNRLACVQQLKPDDGTPSYMNNDNIPASITGLTGRQVAASAAAHGTNQLSQHPAHRLFFLVVKEIVMEPMFVLLLAACIIYFLVGQVQEGFIMLVAIFLVAGISMFQEYRSKNAINALKKLSAPQALVLRNEQWQSLPTEQLVVGDVVRIEEGELVPADGNVLLANDLSLNESILTGEAFAVQKIANGSSRVYKGTLVVSGSATLEVAAVGQQTELGKIGDSLSQIAAIKTPLQLQIRSFVKNMVWIGALAFACVVGVRWYQTAAFIASLLHGLTLAMSVLPEEIPVAFSTFQALGAFRLLRHSIIVKQPQYVETLGAATVICTDKTGTLTVNEMSVAALFDATSQQWIMPLDKNAMPAALLSYAMWASETTPFDPMEKAIHQLYEQHEPHDQRPLWTQVHEYPIGGNPPMMTHIFANAQGQKIIAAKGAPEAILHCSTLPIAAQHHITHEAMKYANRGLRVLAVGKAVWPGNNYPVAQQDFRFELLGLLAFEDPPKPNMAATIETFHKAGIAVKMITGDYAATALTIANQLNLSTHKALLTGNEVMALTMQDLQAQVKETNIFARMYPEAKMKVIRALQNNGEVVAMTGDGVNDAPALKAAHIGIAMGSRGSEVAKNAASLILVDDDLSHMTEAVAQGRKIYDNLQKAIRYIVSIHIPIILIVTLPLVFLWKYTGIFSPVHVIFLELIMGPTCSIMFENEPMEPNTMQRPPRQMSDTFLNFRQLAMSIIQGLAITLACLGIGYYFLQLEQSETLVRTIIFITLLFSNIFLTLVNRSFYYSIFNTLQYNNRLVPVLLLIISMLMAMVLFFPWMQQLFGTTPLTITQLVGCAAAAAAGTLWLEGWKALQRRRHPRPAP